jgi:hypothetical protein
MPGALENPKVQPDGKTALSEMILQHIISHYLLSLDIGVGSITDSPKITSREATMDYITAQWILIYESRKDMEQKIKQVGKEGKQ